jgi:branched-chain amino acid transport system permease protein
MTNALALAAVTVAALVAPYFVYPVVLMTILCFIVLACSFNLLLGYAGLLCFGQAMFFGGAAYVTGYVLKNTSASVEIGIFAGAAAAALLGVFVGLIAVKRNGMQFAMITFAIAQFVYFVCLKAKFTGGEDGLQRIPRNDFLGFINVSGQTQFYYLILAFTIVAIALFYRIVHSPFGEVLTAIRDNEARVETLGFKPERFKLIAIVLSAAMAGLAGGMKATVYQFATLTDVSWPVSGEIILMTLLGGLGTLTGPMIGAIMIILMNDHLAQFGEWALIAQGVVLLVVIMFLRRGVVGEFNALLLRRRQSKAT